MPTKPTTLQNPAALSRRSLLRSGAAGAAAGLIPLASLAQVVKPGSVLAVAGSGHWATKVVGSERVRLHLWRKPAAASGADANSDVAATALSTRALDCRLPVLLSRFGLEIRPIQ